MTSRRVHLRASEKCNRKIWAGWATAQLLLGEYSTEHKNFCSYERKEEFAQGLYKVEETGIVVISFLAPWTVLRGLELNGIIFCEIQGK